MKLSSSSLEKTAQKNPRHLKWRGFLIVDDYFFLAAFLRRFGAAFFAAGLAAAFLRFFGAAAGLAAAFLRFFGAVFFAAATCYSYRNGSDPSPKPVRG